LEQLSAAIESGAGLPAVTRAAAQALGASLALIDRSSAVLGVAASSQAEEKKLLSGADDVERVELRVADAVVGELRFRWRGDAASPVVARMVSTLLALEVERSRCIRSSEEFSVCILDVDYFKKVNDTLGHLAGDKVLKHFANEVKKTLRTIDSLGRFGGEEFLRSCRVPTSNRRGCAPSASGG